MLGPRSSRAKKRWTGLEGPDVPELSLRLFQTMQRRLEPGPAPGKVLWEGTERDPEEFRRIMVEEQRLIYQFEVVRTYGLYQQPPRT